MKTKPKYPPQEWIDEAIDEVPGLTRQRVAKAMGYTRTSIYRITRGLVRFRPEWCGPLAAIFKTTPEDIARRAGIDEYGVPARIADDVLLVRKLTPTTAGPVLSGRNVATIGRLALSPRERGAVEMPDATMTPCVHPGDWVVYHLSAIPRPGKLVVAFCHGGIVLVRHLDEVTGPIYRLKSLHPKAIRDERPVKIHPVVAIIVDPLINA